MFKRILSFLFRTRRKCIHQKISSKDLVALRDYYRIEYRNNDHASPTGQVRVQDRLGSIWYRDKFK